MICCMNECTVQYSTLLIAYVCVTCFPKAIERARYLYEEELERIEMEAQMEIERQAKEERDRLEREHHERLRREREIEEEKERERERLREVAAEAERKRRAEEAAAAAAAEVPLILYIHTPTYLDPYMHTSAIKMLRLTIYVCMMKGSNVAVHENIHTFIHIYSNANIHTVHANMHTYITTCSQPIKVSNPNRTSTLSDLHLLKYTYIRTGGKSSPPGGEEEIGSQQAGRVSVQPAGRLCRQRQQPAPGEGRLSGEKRRSSQRQYKYDTEPI